MPAGSENKTFKNFFQCMMLRTSARARCSDWLGRCCAHGGHWRRYCPTRCGAYGTVCAKRPELNTPLSEKKRHDQLPSSNSSL
jgi:hypothetical protein